jgi:hypothetical protein
VTKRIKLQIKATKMTPKSKKPPYSSHQKEGTEITIFEKAPQKIPLYQHMKEPSTATSPRLVGSVQKMLHLPLVEGAGALRVFT